MAKKDLAEGRYLYGVISDNNNLSLGAIGINGKNVYSIHHGNLVAVVSDCPLEGLRPERRHLKAHQGVIKRLMEDTTPLPMAFGIIGGNSKAVENILTANKQVLTEQLQRVEGKMEMGLRVSWDVGNIFEFFVATHSDLRIARDRFFGTNREPSPENKLELGRIFERILNEDRERYADQVEEFLGIACDEMKHNPCRNEREVINLACLIRRKDEARFEDAVFKVAALFDNNYTFDYTGPWAPHNFVDVTLSI